MEIRYIAPPTIADFQESDAFFRIVKGPIGSGKTSGCVMELIRRAAEQRPGQDGIRRSRWAVIRNTYRELEDTTRQTFEEWIPSGPDGMGDWRESDFAFDLKFNDVEAEILFRSLDKPEHARKLLSLDLTGAYINEIREISKGNVDALKSRLGRYPKRDDGGPTWFGMWGDTNAWHSGHWGAKMFAKVSEGFAFRKIDGRCVRLYAKDGTQFELYTQPGGRTREAENIEKLPPGYYERLLAGAERDWVSQYIDGIDGASVVGSIYGDLISELESTKNKILLRRPVTEGGDVLGGIFDFRHPVAGIQTTWDLGRSDATSIWFWRHLSRDKIEIVDYYENSMKPISHYFKVVDGRGYNVVRHWLPHDARKHEMGSELSVEEQAHERWPGKISICPRMSIIDGISAARWLLEGRARFHTRCNDGVEMLRNYRREWDPVNKVYKNNPVHDYTSHAADALRYLATVVKASYLAGDRSGEQRQGVIEMLSRPPTLEEAFRDHERAEGKIDRID